MRKRSYTKYRHHNVAAGTHSQKQMSPLGCAKWLMIPALCFFLFLLITTISGAQTNTPSSQVGQKQQILQQQIDEGRKHLQPKTGPDTQVPTVQPPMPHQAGIINERQTPFSPAVFTARNAWQGPVGSEWIVAYAGAQTNPNGTQGRGGLVLYTAGDFALSYLGTFLAPAGTPALTIIKVQGDVLLLQAASRQALAFNLQSHQYGLLE